MSTTVDQEPPIEEPIIPITTKGTISKDENKAVG